jgi:hypothetical protein
MREFYAPQIAIDMIDAEERGFPLAKKEELYLKRKKQLYQCLLTGFL